jgi:hypothetical protein
MNQESFLEINAQGLIGGHRHKQDGCVIIGTKPAFGDPSKPALNDYNVEVEESDEGKRHMIIKYNMIDRRYYLQDLGNGSGTFVKIDNPLRMKNGYIISFGDSHMTVSFFQDSVSKNQIFDRI